MTTLTNAPDCPCPGDFLASRVLPDGRVLAIVPLLFDRARLTLGHGWDYYETGY